MNISKSIGRPVQHNERVATTVPLPMEARIKTDKMRGYVPLRKYLCRIICEHVGISEETYNQKSDRKTWS